jgi:glycosyltransferase involved in cell wall biosynthesis
MTPYGGKPDAVEIVEVGGGRYAFSEKVGGDGANFWIQYFRNSFFVTASALLYARRYGIKHIYISDCEYLMASLLLLALPDRGRRILMQVNAANFGYGEYRSANPVKRLYKAFQASIFRHALQRRIAGINVLGEWHSGKLRQQLRLADTYPILVVPDGADLGDAPADRAQARAALGLPQTSVLVLAFGNMRRDKDYPALFAALEKVSTPGLQLMLAGHLAEYSRAQIDVMMAGAKKAGRIALFHPDFATPGQVKQFFSAADALILPYAKNYTDGSGPLRKEAATYARAVLASDVAEMPALIRAHDLGLVYHAGDVDALAAVLDKFAALPQVTRDRMGTNCRRLGEENSWASMARKFASFLGSPNLRSERFGRTAKS